MKLFPFVGTFPWRLEDRKEKKTCWFQCFDHAEKYILRYSLTKVQYKLQEAIGNTWEWDETPEVLDALKVLHDTERKHAESGGDFGVGK